MVLEEDKKKLLTDLGAQMWAVKHTSHFPNLEELKYKSRPKVAWTLVKERDELQELTDSGKRKFVDAIMSKYSTMHNELKSSFVKSLKQKLEDPNAPNGKALDIFQIAHGVLVKVVSSTEIIAEFADQVDESLSDKWAVDKVDGLMLQVVKHKLKVPSPEAVINALRSLERPNEVWETKCKVYDALQKHLKADSIIVHLFAVRAIHYWKEVYCTGLVEANTESLPATLRNPSLSRKSIEVLQLLWFKSHTNEAWEEIFLKFVAEMMSVEKAQLAPDTSLWAIDLAMCSTFVDINRELAAVPDHELLSAETVMKRVDKKLNVEENNIRDTVTFNIQNHATVYMAGYAAHELTTSLIASVYRSIKSKVEKSEEKYLGSCLRSYSSWAAVLAYNTDLDELTEVPGNRASESRWKMFHSEIHARSGGGLLVPHETLVNLIAALNDFIIDYIRSPEWTKNIVDGSTHGFFKSQLKENQTVKDLLESWRKERVEKAEALKEYVDKAYSLASQDSDNARIKELAAGTLVAKKELSMDAINTWMASDASKDIIIDKYCGAVLGKAIKQKTSAINFEQNKAGISSAVREYLKNTTHKRSVEAAMLSSSHDKKKKSSGRVAPCKN